MTRAGHLVAAALAGLTTLAACGGSAAHPAARGRAGADGWRGTIRVKQVVDITVRPTDQRLVVAANGSLALVRPGGRLRGFARGRGGYATRRGPEPYIALARGQAVAASRCRFPKDGIYALEPVGRPGVVAVDGRGRARRFVDLPAAGLLSGIAVDTTGSFGHRLLVTATASSGTTVFAIDCRGKAKVLTRTGPAVEGGIAVAPRSFGRFAGRLIAPDERSGRIFAIAPSGRATLVADSGLSHGPDTGVESEGFVPRGFGSARSAYLADRVSPGNPHPGDDTILELSGRSLVRKGVRAGDLLVAAEAGARTIAVRCGDRCSVKHVADGPGIAHAEGHIAFAPRR